MSEENLNGSQHNHSNSDNQGQQQRNGNEDKVNSVKKMIQSLKAQLEQEKALRQEEHSVLQEEQEKVSEQRKEILQLQDVISQLNDSIQGLEQRNEALTKKIEDITAQHSKEKRKGGGGLLSNLFSGKQKQQLETLESQLLQYEEELTIKTEEAERLHVQLYEIKKEFLNKIEALTQNLEESTSEIKIKSSQMAKLEEIKAEALKQIDCLQGAKKQMERDIEAAAIEAARIKKQFQSETLSFSQVIAIQKELLEIQIPSLKKHTIVYDSLNSAEALQKQEQQQHGQSFKEKEREVFKTFNWQRECLKKQILGILTVFEQKAQTLQANIDAQESNNLQKDRYFQRISSSSCALKQGIICAFQVLDRVVNLEYQISAARQALQTIEVIELTEQKQATLIQFLDKLEELKPFFAAFLNELPQYLSQETSQLVAAGNNNNNNNKEQQSQQKSGLIEEQIQNIFTSAERIQETVNGFIVALQTQVAGNITDAKHFNFLKEKNSDKTATKEQLVVVSYCDGVMNKIIGFFEEIQQVTSMESESLAPNIAQNAQNSQLQENATISSNSLTTPKALINQNETLHTSFSAFKAAFSQSKEFLAHFFNSFSLKEDFVQETFKQIDLLRVVDEYITRIGRSVEFGSALAEQTMIFEMSNRISNFSAQINSFQGAVSSQNIQMKGLLQKNQILESKISSATKIISQFLENSFPSQIDLGNIKSCLETLSDSGNGNGLSLTRRSLAKKQEAAPEDKQQQQIDDQKILKEIAPNLQDEKVKAQQIFEKSREKILTLIHQEKRMKEQIRRSEEKDVKLKKCTEENLALQQLIEKLKISQNTSGNGTITNQTANSSTSMNTAITQSANLIDLL